MTKTILTGKVIKFAFPFLIIYMLSNIGFSDSLMKMTLENWRGHEEIAQIWKSSGKCQVPG